MSQQTQKETRKRYLNIIYFVDSAKTKTFKLSLKKSYLLLVALCVTMFWATASTYLLYDSYQTDYSQRHRIRNLLSTVFAYQTRYDEIYEKAYPNHEESSIKSEEQLVDEDPEEQKSEEPVEKPVTLAAKSKTAVTNNTDEIKEKPDIDKPAVRKGIRVEQFRLSESSDAINLEFAIKNLDRPERTHGYVVGTATFVTSEDQKIKLTSPAGVDPEVEQKASRLPRDNRFAIKYFTTKNLRFRPPSGKEGRFEKVEVLIRSKDNPVVRKIYNFASNEGRFEAGAEKVADPKKTSKESKAQSEESSAVQTSKVESRQDAEQKPTNNPL